MLVSCDTDVIDDIIDNSYTTEIRKIANQSIDEPPLTDYYWYHGKKIYVVAPGTEIPTTDLLGTSGYDKSDYTMNFAGTSAACPHVAAVAALILSVNPNLTGKKVNQIIQSTARKVGTYKYSVTS